MHFIFSIISWLIINLTCLQVEARDINYVFFIKPSYIDVQLCTTGNQEGKTKFLRPTIFLFDNNQDQNVKIYINGIKKNIDTNKDYLAISHKPYATICLRYTLQNSQYDSNLYFSLSSGNFVLLGKNALATLQGDSDELHNITFSWPEYNKFIISNFGQTNSNNLTIKTNNKTLSESFFVGGDLIIEPINDLDQKSAKIIFFHNFPINRKALVTYMQKMIKHHHNFFEYIPNKDEYYLFTIDPIHQYDITGTRGETSSFAYQTITIGNLRNYDNVLEHIIAHEHLHKWFGYTIKQDAEMQYYNSWFMEGFVNYYASYLNYKNGLWSLNQYLTNYNSCLLQYFSSPLNTATSEEINNNFSLYSNIAYQRGQILAHELNFLIEKHTNNAFTLDHYIKNLVVMSKQDPNFKFSNSTFSKILWELYAYDAYNYIQQNIIKSNVLIKAPTILDGKAKLIKKLMPVADYGFDMHSSFLNFKIYGVKKHSTAYKAGLRNKQKILAIWHPNNYKQYLKLEVEQDGVTKIIKIDPIYNLITVPQYVPV